MGDKAKWKTGATWEFLDLSKEDLEKLLDEYERDLAKYVNANKQLQAELAEARDLKEGLEDLLKSYEERLKTAAIRIIGMRDALEWAHDELCADGGKRARDARSQTDTESVTSWKNNETP